VKRGRRTVRKNIRIPGSLMDEVDRVVRASGLYVNRQQFVESAIREKVERVGLFAGGNPGFVGFGLGARGLSGNPGDGFFVRVRETFLLHTVMGLVRGGLPADHSDLGVFERKVRAYVRRRAEVEGRELTEGQVEELTENLLDYHREILEGLNVLNRAGLR